MKKINCILISSALLTISACTAPLIIVGTTAGVITAITVTDRRSASKIFEDQSVETQLTDFIYGHEKIGKKVSVDVTSFNSTVLLTGQAPDEESKNIILKKANRLRYVDKVVDAIEVKPSASIFDKNNDRWLTTKTKSALMINKSIITNTKIVTADRKIYIMGIVSNSEAEKILDIVKTVSGASAIVPLFDAQNQKLDENLTAAVFKPKEKKIIQEKTLEEKLDEEELIEVKPYVLPSPVKLSTDE